mmetsp:Transcript_15835/g.28144  ORF Transcript_15835/g.28144 Transcript_15835/m.28144 type:complete len:443 (+) Transcript_15835:113-1441(+)
MFSAVLLCLLVPSGVQSFEEIRVPSFPVQSERNCSERTVLERGSGNGVDFRCRSSGNCVDIACHCNGVNDCNDQSDEVDCLGSWTAFRSSGETGPSSALSLLPAENGAILKLEAAELVEDHEIQMQQKLDFEKQEQDKLGREVQAEEKRQEVVERQQHLAEEESPAPAPRVDLAQLATEAVQQEMEEESACKNAAQGTDCANHILFAMNHGISASPAWYPGLSPTSSFRDFQALLHLVADNGCSRPCTDEDEGCLKIEDHNPCLLRIQWVRKVEMIEHKDWYPELAKDSSDHQFAQSLYERGVESCRRPCKDGEEEDPNLRESLRLAAEAPSTTSPVSTSTRARPIISTELIGTEEPATKGSGDTQQLFLARSVAYESPPSGGFSPAVGALATATIAAIAALACMVPRRLLQTEAPRLTDRDPFLHIFLASEEPELLPSAAE